MPRAPMAEWKPFTGKSQRSLAKDIICVHTMVGKLIGSWNYANGDGNPYWHFGLGADGRLLQCVDLDYRSAANLEGNDRVIPIETEDGYPDGRTSDAGQVWAPWSGSNVPAWTDPQIDKLVDLIAWLCKTFEIPAVLIPDTKQGRRGLAYHRQGIDPWRVSGGELWSNADGKVCPGDRRISQFTQVVIPKVQAQLTAPPPPTSPSGDDSMFFYDLNVNGVTRLIQVAGGKQTRVIGATYSAKCRAHPDYLGLADDQQGNWYVKNYGPVVGL